MISAIDVNCDLGEGGNAEGLELLKGISSCISSGNVACGFHAGSPRIMRSTIQLLLESKLSVGAHPSFFDPDNFGRKEFHLEEQVIYDQVLYQIGAASGMVQALGGNLSYVKPHGALYNMAARDIRIADAVVNAVVDYNKSLILYGLAGSILIQRAEANGVACVSEVFGDRLYLDDGSLARRDIPGAVIENIDVFTEQIKQIVKNGCVISKSGKQLLLRAESICLHGDNKNVLVFARQLKKILDSLGVIIRPYKK